MTYRVSQTDSISQEQYEMRMKALLEPHANTQFACDLIEAQARGQREEQAIARHMWLWAIIGSLAIVSLFTWKFWL